MNEHFSCSDKETLIAYIYGEGDAADRPRIDAHLATCEACASEVTAFGGVREALADWTPPVQAGSFRIVREEAGGTGSDPAAPPVVRGGSAVVLRPARWWQRPLPVWARAAAAVLLFAGGAALANLDVRYGPEGLTVRTGWQHAAPLAARQQPAGTAGPAAATPWRSDLVALERQLRGDFATQLQVVRAAAPTTVAPAAPLDDRQLMTRVRALVDQSIGESEQRQQREFAYRVAQLQGEVGAQRRADLFRLQAGLGQIQGQTGAEVAQQRQLINYLLTVSQKK
jgi:anti-sigma factor RsiW